MAYYVGETWIHHLFLIPFQIRSGNEFYYNENLADVNIDESNMKSFLTSESKNLNILSTKHLEKINHW